MFSMVPRSTPWKKADKKKQHYDGDPPQTVPLHMYEKLQLQLMETIDALSERDSEVSSLTSRIKIQTANSSVLTYKLDALENTIEEKDSEIDKLKQELSVLRGNGPTELQVSKKKEKKEKQKKSKSKSNQSDSHGLKKSGKKKKKNLKRITLHNHELSKASEQGDKQPLLATTKCGSVGSNSEDSSDRGMNGSMTKPLEAQHEFENNVVDRGTGPEDVKEEPQDDSMHSQANLCYSPGQGLSRRQTLPPSHRFWKFRSPQLVSPSMSDRPFLDPTMLEMIDEVSDLTRSYRSEFSVSIWSPSPIVKRREIVMSEADKAAIGISGLVVGDNVQMPRRGSIDSGIHDNFTKLVRSNSLKEGNSGIHENFTKLTLSNSLKEGKAWMQMAETSIVEEESIEEESVEEEITDESDGDEDTTCEDILEDDSIASSSMSC
ncbi:unnamed protein product [Cylindrotheca closterium]|uniref:Uncharacterized protein n=1 Tax=Cylindrotheca closterium TaxID=2856 RepID=A0AAD2G2H8_9STRA|nr:unnamed protein product [Cylindrotheca closterium]